MPDTHALSDSPPVTPTPRAPDGTVLLLALMMFLVPALGARSDALLQDTLKSILVASFTLGAAGWFFWQRRSSTSGLRLHVLLGLPLLLMAWALGSMVWSHPYLGGVEAIRWFLFGLILFLGLNTLTPARITWLAAGIHLGAFFAALWAALQFWINFGFFSHFAAPASTFVNRNFLAEFLVCTLPFSVLLITRTRHKPVIGLLLVSLGFNIVALMMAGARSALVSLLVLLPTLAAIVWRYRQQLAPAGWRAQHTLVAVAVVLGTIGTLGALPTANPQLIAETGTGNALDRAFQRTASVAQPTEYSSGSFSVRALMWRATGRMILAHPITGVGAGAWEVEIPRYQEAGSQLETDFYAHNEPLQLLAEYGLAGWLALLGLLTYLLWAAYRTVADDSPQGRQEAPLRALTLSSLMVLLLVSNAGFPWRLASTGALFALSLAILAASDVRLLAQQPFVWRPLAWNAHRAQTALGLTALCAMLTAYIAQQAVACESRLVRAFQLTQAIAQSGQPTDPRWYEVKAEVLRLTREGIAINPHYRKITPLVADALASWNDWANAAWIWESVLRSRPHIVVIATNVARAYLELGDYPKAQAYLEQAAKVQPSAPAILALQTELLIRLGQYREAAQIVRTQLRIETINNDFVNMAYLLGLRTQHWELAIRALELRIQKWPREAAEAWLHLGNIYRRPELNNEEKALESYQAALAAAPPYLRSSLLAQIPASYQTRLALSPAQ